MISPRSRRFVTYPGRIRRIAGLLFAVAVISGGCSDVLDPDDDEEIGAPVQFTTSSGVEPMISAGYYITCALRRSGVINCWGRNNEGGAPPVKTAATGKFVAVGGGYFHACGIRDDGAAECWGHNAQNQAPPLILPDAGSFVQIRVNASSTCALRSDGVVQCWGGEIAAGQFGYFTASTGSFVQLGTVGTSANHMCAVREDGIVQCSGDNQHNQAPATKAPLTGHFVEVSDGYYHSCALRDDGAIECWGDGEATYGSDMVPAVKTATAGTYVGVMTNGESTCGLRSDGVIECWGSGHSPLYLHGDSLRQTLPLVQMAVGALRVCALRTDDLVVCPPGTGVHGEARSEQRVQIISAPPAIPMVGNAIPFTFTSTSEAIPPNPPSSVVMISLAPDICQPDGGTTAQLLARGTCTLVANSDGDPYQWFPAADTQSFTVYSLPAQPTDFAATAAPSSTVELSWNDSSDDETGFRIRRRMRNVDGTYTIWSTIATPNANAEAYTDNALAEGSYVYRLESCSDVGCSGGVGSGLVHVFAVPAAPAAVIATAASEQQISLSWTDNSSNETSFRIQKRVRDGTTWGRWQSAGTTGGNEAAFVDTVVEPGKRHEYRIRACNSAGCSPYVRGGAAFAASLPEAPGDFVGANESANVVRLTWSDLTTNESRFHIQRRARSGGIWGAWSTIAEPGPNETSVVDNVATSTLYNYRIRACNVAGCSVYVSSGPLTSL